MRSHDPTRREAPTLKFWLLLLLAAATLGAMAYCFWMLRTPVAPKRMRWSMMPRSSGWDFWMMFLRPFGLFALAALWYGYFVSSADHLVGHLLWGFVWTLTAVGLCGFCTEEGATIWQAAGHFAGWMIGYPIRHLPPGRALFRRAERRYRRIRTIGGSPWSQG